MIKITLIKMYKYYYLVFFLIINTCFSQNTFTPTKYQLESGFYLSTSGQIPFWLRSNQYGIVPLESQIATIRGAAYKEYDSTRIYNQTSIKKVDIGYGMGLVVNAGKKNSIILPEAYMKIRFGIFEFYGGRRKEIVGLVDTTLTTGSYIWSGNALPMPKLQLSIPNYVSVLGKGLFSIKGGYAHGWFNSAYIKNYYLHQKWIYARLGKPNWKVKFYGGLNHQVQWGGKPAEPYVEPQTGQLITKLPSDLATYFRVISGVSLNTSDNGTNTGIPLNESWNRAGNHLGTLDIASEMVFRHFNILAYRQSIYEDGSLFYLNNISDGLLGISVKRKNIKKGIYQYCFEYINTISQGGNTGSENTIAQLRGQDNYFNNSVYLNGWSYEGNIIGTPLFTTLAQINPKSVSGYGFTNTPKSFIVNNRVKGYNFTFAGKSNKYNFISRVSWSSNKGFYGFDIEVKQFSFSQQVNYQLNKCVLNMNLSFDKGTLYPNTLGCYVGVRRVFF